MESAPVLVIGAGVAGCAAAVAVAATGVPVLLYEASATVGGVAVRGEHRTLCGLAPIAADEPSLLEPALVGDWVAAVSHGEPYRHGRVWLWPTSARALHDGLQKRLAESQVPCRFNQRIVGLTQGAGGIVAVKDDSGSEQHVAAVIDASGVGVVANLLGQAYEDGSGWPAHRSVVALEGFSDEKRSRLQALQTIHRTLADQAAVALTPLAGNQWQLSLDVSPGTTVAEAAALAERAVGALGGQVVQQAVAIAERDGGRPAGHLDIDTLFAQRERGLCWAAWPEEFHGASGVTWTWPPNDRHGIPEHATRLASGPKNLWLIGRGMPVSAAAAAALRVTGTCFALGAAVGAVVAQYVSELDHSDHER